MRLVYVDEAGTAHKELFLVVAGIIVNADQQWKALEERLHKLVPPDIAGVAEGTFIFHATELYSGGKTFKRDVWPKEKRWALLEKILMLPAEFRLPLVMGFDKKVDEHPKTRLIMSHMLAFSECIVKAEQFMRKHADKGEVAIVTAEDNTETRQALKIASDALKGEKPDPCPPNMEHAPLTRIVDTVHFAQKHEASLLQIADACAFVLKRHLMQAPNNERFLQALFGGALLPVNMGKMLKDPSGGFYSLPLPAEHPVFQPSIPRQGA